MHALAGGAIAHSCSRLATGEGKKARGVALAAIAPTAVGRARCSRLAQARLSAALTSRRCPVFGAVGGLAHADPSPASARVRHRAGGFVPAGRGRSPAAIAPRRFAPARAVISVAFAGLVRIPLPGFANPRREPVGCVGSREQPRRVASQSRIGRAHELRLHLARALGLRQWSPRTLSPSNTRRRPMALERSERLPLMTRHARSVKNYGQHSNHRQRRFT